MAENLHTTLPGRVIVLSWSYWTAIADSQKVQNPNNPGGGLQANLYPWTY